MTVSQIVNLSMITYGVASLVVSFIVSGRTKNRLLKFYMPLHFLLVIRQAVFTLQNFQNINGVVITVIHYLTLMLFLSSLILFVEELHKPYSKQSVYIPVTVAILFIAGCIIFIYLFIKDIDATWSISIFFYSLFLIILIRGRILIRYQKKRSWYKRASIIYGLMIILTPVLVLDEVLWVMLYSDLFLSPSLFYLIWNTVSIIVLAGTFRLENNQEIFSQEIHSSLSKREMEISALICRGYTYQQIADNLFISYSTVKTHVYNIYKKLDIGNKMELVNLFRSVPDKQ